MDASLAAFESMLTRLATPKLLCTWKQNSNPDKFPDTVSTSIMTKTYCEHGFHYKTILPHEATAQAVLATY